MQNIKQYIKNSEKFWVLFSIYMEDIADDASVKVVPSPVEEVFHLQEDLNTIYVWDAASKHAF